MDVNLIRSFLWPAEPAVRKFSNHITKINLIITAVRGGTQAICGIRIVQKFSVNTTAITLCGQAFNCKRASNVPLNYPYGRS